MESAGMKSTRVVAGWAGIAAVLAAVPGTYVLGLFSSGYDPVRLTISELGERGAATATAAAVLFFIAGLCEIVFAAGLSLSSKSRVAALAGSIFLAVNGLSDYIGSAVFPIDSGGAFDSPSGQMHFLVSVIGMSAMVFPAFFYARVLESEGRKAEAKASLAFAVVICAAAAFFNVAFFTERLVGLAQRALDIPYFGWILFMSVGLLRGRKGA